MSRSSFPFAPLILRASPLVPSLLLGVVLLLGCGDSGTTDPEPDEPDPEVIPVRLRFNQQPTDVTVGDTMSPVVVAVVGSNGALATGASPRITLQLRDSDGLLDTPLMGTSSLTAVEGVARFDDLSIDSVADGYRLRAEAEDLNVSGVFSVPFDVRPPAASALAFQVEPSDISVGSAIGPAVEVVVVDGTGDVIEGFATTVDVALTPGAGSSEAQLHGISNAATVEGVATLPHLTVTEPGTGYTLTASSPSLASIESASFDVAPWTGTPTSIELESDPGDPIGQGGAYSYTLANAVVEAIGGHTAPIFNLRVRGDESWSATFKILSDAEKLEPGVFPQPDAGELAWAGEGRSCLDNTGSFTVDAVTYLDTLLTDLSLDFEQTCAGATGSLRGTIHWARYDDTTPPGPVRPIPSDLWQPAEGATPSAGSFVYLESEPGDYVGQGGTYTVTAVDTPQPFDGGVGIVAGDWSGHFQPMSSIDQLKVGYYPDLQRYPGHNATKGGLTWSGQGRGCNEVTGWFAVDAITYGSGGIEALDLRFEQFCDGSSAALRGVIHWEG